MAKYLHELDFIYPHDYTEIVSSRRSSLERKESEFARTGAQLSAVAKKIDVLESELRSPVSSRNNYAEIDRLRIFADNLIRTNVRKQAEPDIVARNIRRSTRLLAELPRATVSPKRFDTAWHPGRRVDVSPRTVFGTDAWTRSGSSIRRAFVTKTLALPCVERIVRREVIFAKRKGGKGYRVPHRMSKFSDIWC